MGYNSFEAYLEEKFPDFRRKVYCLMSIHDHLQQIPAPEIGELGWSKALELAKVARSKGRRSDRAPWLYAGAKSCIKTRVYACARSAPAVCSQPSLG